MLYRNLFRVIRLTDINLKDSVQLLWKIFPSKKLYCFLCLILTFMSNYLGINHISGFLYYIIAIEQ